MERVSTFRTFTDTVDERVGDTLEHVLSTHHAVRSGNSMEVLVDGEEALPAIQAAIEGARRQVHIANWHASPDFRLTREPGAPTLRRLLAETAGCVPVRLPLWAGPPVPVFQPTRGLVKAAREEFTRDSAVRCVFDWRERTMYCHHEKLVIVDDETAFVGGLDLTALQGDRHASAEHPPDRDLGWHDLVVPLRGPVVADVAEHFRHRWTEVAGEKLAPAAAGGPAGRTDVQPLRTVPDGTYDLAPRGEFTILDAYLRALRSAKRPVYLENQFLWSPEVAEVLIDKLRDPPDPRFRVVLLLPRSRRTARTPPAASSAACSPTRSTRPGSGCCWPRRSARTATTGTGTPPARSTCTPSWASSTTSG